jgi:hypothetical protein
LNLFHFSKWFQPKILTERWSRGENICCTFSLPLLSSAASSWEILVAHRPLIS